MVSHPEQSQEPHDILWRNVQVLRDVLRTLSEQARDAGDGRAADARSFVDRKLGEIARGSSLDDLRDDLELLYRKIIALAVSVLGDITVAPAFIGSARMLLSIIKPDLTDDELGAQIEQSMDRAIADADE
ncbi:hypothetical protein ACQP00_15465 [Dactylosporangium sp. CS-047395]|uniref:hypothetical protein n=1 Tax=Dactylosporangium sp. CS-047395 TaxID=3239936 RepID=UPI003D8AD953